MPSRAATFVVVWASGKEDECDSLAAARARIRVARLVGSTSVFPARIYRRAHGSRPPGELVEEHDPSP